MGGCVCVWGGGQCNASSRLVQISLAVVGRYILLNQKKAENAIKKAMR